MSKVSINGRMVHHTDAKISIFDRGYLYGEGLFETLRAYSGHPAFCALHYHRLRENCERLGIDLPLDEYAFEKAINKVLAGNRLRDAVVRVTVSGAATSADVKRAPRLAANVVIFGRKHEPRALTCYTEGASVIVVTSVIGESPALANLKSTSYLSRMLARMEVQQAAADEGLILNERSWVLEGTLSNLFLVRKNRLYTAPITDGILPGVTRFVVLGIADSLNIPWREAHISLENLRSADELFLTGSTTEVMPLREVRKVTRKSVTPGPITKRIMASYQELLPR